MAVSMTVSVDGHNARPTDLRILVVDDNFDAADSLAILLKMWGHEVQVAYDGASALQTALSYLPAVILLDIALPKIDGFQLARRFRQEAELKEAVLIAVTGYGDEGHRVQWEGAFDHYLIKPVETDHLQALLTTLRRVLSLPRRDNAGNTLRAGDTIKVGNEETGGPEQMVSALS